MCGATGILLVGVGAGATSLENPLTLFTTGENMRRISFSQFRFQVYT